MLQATIRGVDLYGRPGMGNVDLYGQVGQVDLYGGRSMGLGSATSDVTKLQQALAAYAANGHPEANPGPINGVVGDATRTAVFAVIGQLRKLPDYVKKGIQIAGALAYGDPEAVNKAITSAAAVLAVAVRADTVLVGTGSGLTPEQDAAIRSGNAAAIAAANAAAAGGVPGAAASKVGSFFDIPPGETWYQQSWGLGALGVGAVLLIATALKLVK